MPITPNNPPKTEYGFCSAIDKEVSIHIESNRLLENYIAATCNDCVMSQCKHPECDYYVGDVPTGTIRTTKYFCKK